MDRDINFAAQCLLAMSTGCVTSFIDAPGEFDRNTKPLDLSSCQIGTTASTTLNNGSAKVKRLLFAEKKTIKLDNDVIVKIEKTNTVYAKNDERTRTLSRNVFSQEKSTNVSNIVQNVNAGNDLTWTVKQEPELDINDSFDAEHIVGPHHLAVSTINDHENHIVDNNNSTKQNKMIGNHVKHRAQLKTMTTKPPPLFLTAQTLLALKKKKKKKKRLLLNGNSVRILQDGII